MKTDVIAFKKQVDEIVFNNESVKSLVEKGYIKPESTIEEVVWIDGKKTMNLTYRYTHCCSNVEDSICFCNEDESEYLFGWTPEHAIEKVSKEVIRVLSRNANPENASAIRRAEEEAYAAYYDGNHYNGD